MKLTNKEIEELQEYIQSWCSEYASCGIFDPLGCKKENRKCEKIDLYYKLESLKNKGV